MKKQALIFTALFSVLFTGVYAQNAFKTGDQGINIMIGLPTTPGRTVVTFPELTASYENALWKKVGIGYITAGGLVGVAGTKDVTRIAGTDVGYKYTHFMFMARAAYHFDFYALSGDSFFKQFDVYAGISSGFRLTIEKEVNSPGYTSPYDPFLIGVFGGARYYFSQGFGVVAEVGHTHQYISGGITFKL